MKGAEPGFFSGQVFLAEYLGFMIFEYTEFAYYSDRNK